MTATSTGPSLTHVIGADGLLSIRLTEGQVRLQAVDGETIRVRDIHDRDLGAMFSVALGDGSASLTPGTTLGVVLGRGRGTPDLAIEIPRGTTVVIDARTADIAADGLVGDQRYRTVSGDVTLHAAGGPIAIDAVSGDIDIVAPGPAALNVRTVSGDVALRVATITSLEATSTSGDFRIAGRLEGEGPFAIVTVSGDVRLAPTGDVRIEMATLSGDLRSELPGRSGGGRGRRSFEIGSRGPLVTVRSMSGDLSIIQATPVEAPATPPVEAATPVVAHVAAADVPAPTSDPVTESDDDARLAILRSLERGEIDVADAGRRLEALDRDPIDPATVTTRTALSGASDA